ncbi:MAG: MBL fold metallo-hydrolase, partial [Minisyncoccota bacterium]
MSKAKLTCYGGVGTVTGANFLLETDNKRVIVDCGLFQGFQTANDENVASFDYDVTQIDSLFVTHAHIDHIGRILSLVRAGFKGVIYSTEETKEIASLMLKDMAHIEGSNEDIVVTVMGLWQTIPYHQSRDFGDYKLELFNAGHILGSAMYKFIFPTGKSLLFSGDIGNSPAPLEGKREAVSGISYLLMDSVYGDRNHPNSEERDAQFKKIIGEVVKKKGTLLIPVFSLERSQIIINEIDKIFGSSRGVPVFLDSPLAIKVTDIYRRVLGDKVRDFDFDKLKETTEVRDSIEIAHVEGPKIILAGSGMSTAGRIVHHEMRYLPDPNTTI